MKQYYVLLTRKFYAMTQPDNDSSWCDDIKMLSALLAFCEGIQSVTGGFPHKEPAYDLFNTLRPRQNGRHFGDDTFKRIFLNESVEISIKISLKFVPKDSINNIPALVQVMAWRRLGDKPLTEPIVVRLLTHICVTRPQWVRWQFCC